RISATIRTARSRSSGGYLLDEPPDMTPSFPRTGVSGHAGAVQCSVCHQRPQGIGGVLAPATLLSGSRAGESTLPVGTAPAAHE
ncbi:hypothetical protein, partial [Mycobacterium tuberculosis]|uniref:hypothetical protein n=1 Tax=Mycobacterium tuberculosis TaxID=1773 RepID=UPI001BE4CDA5